MFDNNEGERIPRVYITMLAKQKMDYCIQLCDYEISGLGEVVRLGNDFLINNIHLFRQEVTSGSTDLSQNAVAKVVVEMMRVGLDVSKLKFWWHSHAGIEPYWSTADMKVIDTMGVDWAISYVGNHLGQYKLRIDFYGDVRHALTGLELKIYLMDDPAIRQLVAQEIEQNVRVKRFILPAARCQVLPENDPEATVLAEG
jgi:hypothetical protein